MLDEEKIIQIGVVFFNVLTEEVLEYKSWYINIGVPLSTFIKKLTRITQADVDGGTDIQTAYNELLEIIGKYKCFRQPVTWGGGDLRALQKEVGRETLGRNEMNVKTLFQAYAPLVGIKARCGLEKACNRVGIGFRGRGHDAVTDAYSTARIYCYFMKKMIKEVKND
jgi:inhibitor of KinA sporulation pathway (predicted exonuclease)